MSHPHARGGAFFVPHDLAQAIRGADHGPLAGLTVAVKDMYDIAGTPTGGGNPDWLARQTPAAAHAPAVRKLLDAGASVVGKTICDEFFFSLTGVNAHYGTPANLRAPDRVPGGSSSGSAAATAAGACDIALGSDTGGSVRIPAAFNGLYGIRTTHGRVDLGGAMEMAPSFDTAGWFASGPGTFRKVGAVLLDGAGVAAPVTRLMIAEDAFANADAAVGDVVRGVLARAAGDLPAPEPLRIADGGPQGAAPAGSPFDPWREAFRVIQGFEVWRLYGDFVGRHAPALGPGIKERMAYAAGVTQAEADAAYALKAAVRDHVRGRVAPGTVVALPTAPCIAPLVASPFDELESFRVRTMRLTCVAGMSGLPQVSIPAGTVAGCPVGLSLIGWAGGDEALIDLAVALARHCGIAHGG